MNQQTKDTLEAVAFSIEVALREEEKGRIDVTSSGLSRGKHWQTGSATFEFPNGTTITCSITEPLKVKAS